MSRETFRITREYEPRKDLRIVVHFTTYTLPDLECLDKYIESKFSKQHDNAPLPDLAKSVCEFIIERVCRGTVIAECQIDTGKTVVTCEKNRLSVPCSKES